jgi:hypothetical protein
MTTSGSLFYLYISYRGRLDRECGRRASFKAFWTNRRFIDALDHDYDGQELR